MIVLKVLSVIIIALLLLTLVNLKARIKVVKNDLALKIYFGLIGYTIIDFSKPPKEKKKKIEEEEEEKPEKEAKEKEPESIEDKKAKIKNYIALAKDMLAPSKKALSTVVRHIRIVKITTDIIIGGEDAHKTALSYSGHVAGINSFLTILSDIVTIKIKKIKMQPDFLSEKTCYNMQAVIKIRVIWLLVAGFYLAKVLLKDILKLVFKKQKKKKVV